ncbi:MAG: nucleoside hydrolase [Leptolyngbya sp. SIO4C1]|nr:nucleoside hydrolase [Leptolyngbya sp. SIO4C1]
MARPLIIDCDPGVDDAIALLLAFTAPQQLDLLGITTVAGNVPLALTATNALKLCELADQTVPVYAGCPRPLLQPLQTAVEVHGATGLQGATLPDPQQRLQPQHGVDFLIEQLLSAPVPMTLAMLGPLTNLAVALIKAPQIVSKIAELVIMGGAVTHGNITPAAEFNVYVDPHAAQVVFTAGIPITLITLDTTHQVLTTPERLAAIRHINRPAAQAAADLLTYYGTPDIERYGMAGAPLHDPCVIAYLLQPDLFTTRPAQVAIETQGQHTLGRTVVDWWHSGPPNVSITDSVDAAGLYDLLTTQLSYL